MAYQTLVALFFRGVGVSERSLLCLGLPKSHRKTASQRGGVFLELILYDRTDLQSAANYMRCTQESDYKSTSIRFQLRRRSSTPSNPTTKIMETMNKTPKIDVNCTSHDSATITGLSLTVVFLLFLVVLLGYQRWKDRKMHHHLAAKNRRLEEGERNRDQNTTREAHLEAT